MGGDKKGEGGRVTTVKGRKSCMKDRGNMTAVSVECEGKARPAAETDGSSGETIEERG